LDIGYGWKSLGRYSHLVFLTGEDALHEAQSRVSWIPQLETWRW
jgi:hypothetical protein